MALVDDLECGGQWRIERSRCLCGAEDGVGWQLYSTMTTEPGSPRLESGEFFWCWGWVVVMLQGTEQIRECTPYNESSGNLKEYQLRI